jgi:glycosyltransferase involved in cell wall biosynthesis
MPEPRETVVPTVSVALCTRNGERFIEEQIRSVLTQTRLPAEIVVSDDSSTDRTVPLIRSVVEAHRLNYPESSIDLTIIVNSIPLGVAANFEQAIKTCTGEFIALCDQDDVWFPERVESALAVFESRPDLLLVHANARLVDESGADLEESLFIALGVSDALQREIHQGGAYELLLRRNLVTGAATMFRRELASLAVPIAMGWLHDEWLAIVAAALDRLDLIAESLIDYRQHGRNQIGVRTLSLREKLGRMVEPGSARNRRLLERATSLAVRLTQMQNIPPARVEAALRKVLHEEFRSGLSPARVLRVAPILRELRTGRYAEFGRGTSDAVRDLLQPLKPLG